MIGGKNGQRLKKIGGKATRRRFKEPGRGKKKEIANLIGGPNVSYELPTARKKKNRDFVTRAS